LLHRRRWQDIFLPRTNDCCRARLRVNTAPSAFQFRLEDVKAFLSFRPMPKIERFISVEVSRSSRPPTTVWRSLDGHVFLCNAQPSNHHHPFFPRGSRRSILEDVDRAAIQLPGRYERQRDSSKFALQIY